jgi:hypothetical protein
MSETSPESSPRQLATDARDRVRFEEEALGFADQVYRVARRMVGTREEAEEQLLSAIHVVYFTMFLQAFSTLPLVMAADGLREQFGSGARATASLPCAACAGSGSASSAETSRPPPAPMTTC